MRFKHLSVFVQYLQHHSCWSNGARFSLLFHHIPEWVFKSERAASVPALPRIPTRKSCSSQAAGRSRCPPGSSREQCHQRWSPLWPGTWAAGWGRSPGTPRLWKKVGQRTNTGLQLIAAALTSATRRLRDVPCSAPSSGSVKRTLRLELSLAELLQVLLPLLLLQLGGGKPSREALLRFRMDTRPSGPEVCGKTREQGVTGDGVHFRACLKKEED